MRLIEEVVVPATASYILCAYTRVCTIDQYATTRSAGAPYRLLRSQHDLMQCIAQQRVAACPHMSSSGEAPLQLLQLCDFFVISISTSLPSRRILLGEKLVPAGM